MSACALRGCGGGAETPRTAPEGAQRGEGVLPEVPWEGGGTSWVRDVLQKAERDGGG